MRDFAASLVDTYRRLTPGSAALHQRAQAALPGGDTRTVTFFTPHPLYIDRAAGAEMWDVDGRRYLDFLGNYTSLVHGHAHPRILEAIAGQAARVTAHAAGSQAAVELAERICGRMAAVEQVRFCNSGTEAVMNAVRAARAFTGRSTILKFEGGYHGSSDVAEISVSPDPERAGPADAPRAVPEEPGIPASVVGDVVVAPYNDLEATQRIVAAHGERLAAILVEPMLGASGAVPSRPGFLTGLRRLCDQTGALLICDEVITFRLSPGGLAQQMGVKADLVTLGKVIGGGLPVGAFGGRAEVMAMFAPPSPRMVQSGTFNANPLTMAAGAAAVDLLTPDEILRINRLGDRLAEGLEEAAAEQGVSVRVTGLGSVRTLHFTAAPVEDYRGVASARSDLTRLFHLGLLNRGVFIAPRGMLVTSTAMGEAEVEQCVEAAADVLGELAPLAPATVSR